MKGNFSRYDFHPSKHYTGVLKQQGRVDLDSDWNEERQIQHHLRYTMAKDTIGASGVPRAGGGFGIGVTRDGQDLTISPGRIYVEGTLCELETGATYADQPDYPNPPELDPEDGRTDLVYLDVWSRHITSVEDPFIREPALGGPDTTTRLQTVWQVKVWKGTVSDEDQQCRAYERPGAWVVSGRVVDREGSPISDVQVEAFDEDWYFHDLLGTVGTDEDGCFEVVYQEEDFRDLIEAAPDLYVRVVDRDGNQLYRSSRVRYEAGRVEYFPIVVRDPHHYPSESTARQEGGYQEDEDWRPFHGWPPPESGGRLSTRAAPVPSVEAVRQEARADGIYRGLENRLYRVEIHRSDDDSQTATFKWSRDNGSVAFRVPDGGVLGQNPLRIKLEGMGRNPLEELRVGDWAEVLSNESELKGHKGILARIDEIGWGERTITLDTNMNKYPGFGRVEVVRRWDQKMVRVWEQKADGTTELKKEDLEEGACLIQEDVWVELEDGVQVRFGGDQDRPYRSGDYWIFSTRSATRSVEQLVEAPPQGIKHRYCPLARLTWRVDQNNNTSAEVYDWRWLFRPLADTTSCTVTVGDGRQSTGDFGDIHVAIEVVPRMRGPVEVCILPGQYDLLSPIQVAGRDDLTIRGFGARTTIRGPHQGPALRLVDCERPELKSLSIVSRSTEAAVEANASHKVRVEDCLIDNVTGPALVVTKGIEVDLASCYLKSDAWVQARGVRVAENHLSGIWIRDGSSKVLVRDNEIGSGRGPGVALGVLFREEEPWAEATGVTQVEIIGNRILDMGNSGIVTADRRLQQEAGLGAFEDITIADNRIVGCARQAPGALLERRAAGGVVLSEASGVRIHRNRIANNGSGTACGVFLFSCQALDITGNVIEENGAPRGDSESWEGHLELRVGIAALFAPGASTDAIHRPSRSAGRRASWAAAPAACIRDNIVGTPGGQALAVIAAGSVLVTGNVFMSRDAPANADQPRGAPANANEQECRAEERPGAWVVSGRVVDGEGRPLAGVRVTVFDRDLFWDDRLGTTTTDEDGCFEVVYDEDDFRDLIEAAPDMYVGVMDEDGNQLYRSPRVRYEAGRSEYFPIQLPLEKHLLERLLQSGACVFVYNVGRTPVIADANSRPGFLSTNLHVRYASEAMADTGDIPSRTFRPPLPDGRVLFHGNQVTLQAERWTYPVGFPEPGVPPFRAGAVALFSSDDVSLQDNQILTEVAGGNVFANVVALAPTVRASGNRFTELPRQARLSYLSLGKMASTTDNQATHGLFTWATEVVDANNQSLVAERIPRRGGYQGVRDD